MNTQLIILTDIPPYQKGSFLDEEVWFLSKYFKQIVIISQQPAVKSTIELLPTNCTCFHWENTLSKTDKLFASFHLFDKTFWKEWNIIKKIYKRRLNKEIIFTMLVSLIQGKRLANFIQKRVDIEKNTFFYSYWCDDNAIALALLKKQFPHVKAISRFHGWDVYFHVHKTNYLPFRHLIINQLDIVFSISEKGKKYAEKYWYLNPQQARKIQVSKLGVRKQNMIPNEKRKPILISCSGIISIKRIHLIVEALKLITGTTLKWVHFGDGNELKKINELAEQLPSNITFSLMGYMSNQKILQWYELAAPSLFINVSSSEGIPVSIMEAMSFGIPVIATDVGGIPEIVTNHNGSLLSENPTPEEIALQIIRFWEMSYNEYSNYSQNALKTWNEKYDSQKNYSDFISHILNLK